jgi:hypothetical protein
MQKKTYIRNLNILTGSLHDQLVMLDIQKGKYFSLNPVATRIWQMLDQPLSLDEMCSRLLDEYEVEPNQCRIDVEGYLLEMIHLELISEG